MLDGKLLTTDEIVALSKIAPREELLAKLAGGMAAPMQQMAGLLKAVPQKFAYALSALIETGGGAPDDSSSEEEAEVEVSEEEAEVEVSEEEAEQTNEQSSENENEDKQDAGEPSDEEEK